MDVVCKAVTTDMDAWSAFGVGPHLSSAKLPFFGVFQVRRRHFTAQIFFGKVRETSTHVQFLLGFWLICNIVILPPDQNNHSQSTGAKDIFKNPTCCQISCW